MKDIIVLGGPNGAGKTTAAQFLLPRELELLEFVNADEIARGLSPFNQAAAALSAGRHMLQRMRMLVADGRSFAFETTCAGKAHASFLANCRKQGWRITLVFLWLSTPELAVERVARRVSEGGHSIDASVIRRRYQAGVTNLMDLYLNCADVAAIYENGDEGRMLIAEKSEVFGLVIHHRVLWQRMQATQS